MVWLRIDVDNPCYYGKRVRIRLRAKLPIPGYYEHVRETLAFLKASPYAIKRTWFIRHLILPPRGLLDDEEIGLHVTEPRNVLSEYREVSERFKRPILKFTRHGHSDMASGREWTKEDFEYVRSVLPNMRDMTDGEHYTVNHRPHSELDAHSEDLPHLDHVLFHPVHFRVAKKELEAVLQRLKELGIIEAAP